MALAVEESPIRQESERPHGIFRDTFEVFRQRYKEIFLIGAVTGILFWLPGLGLQVAASELQARQTLLTERLLADVTSELAATNEADLVALQEVLLSDMASTVPIFVGMALILLVTFTFLEPAWIHAVSEWKITGHMGVLRAIWFAARRMWLALASTLFACLALVIGLGLVALVVSALFAVGGLLGMVGILLFIPAAVSIMVYMSLFMQAAVIERRGPVEAVVRSFQLVSGRWWRVFGVLLLTMVASVLLSILVVWPVGYVLGFLPVFGPFLTSAITGFLSGLLPIVATLLYFDLRTLRDGPGAFTTQRLAADIDMAEASGVAILGGKGAEQSTPAV